ncbi:hypothetical protein AN189_17945 [Loktanella sp. 3ANDIMAR09]|uniref:hypothetical protein n=1 Tax=Loktanella sp. 3ANDIMAR09 TaxID=1225657 RepID=UPI0006F26E91|nr:hypothetical protein [Loktanella sp. 3ANDIMAR09]KQI66940.1 hypothetical protein AN189_17945 [Loktanella sp. 3ANDIMAR09]
MPTATEAQIKRAIRVAQQQGCSAVVVEGAKITILVDSPPPRVSSDDSDGVDAWDKATRAAQCG